MDIVVQVLGKKRAMITVPKDMIKEEILSLAKTADNVTVHLEGKEIVKEIYVPGRLINFVVK